MYRRTLILTLLLFGAVVARGQEVVVKVDTVRQVPVVSEHNPTKALLLSLIPGAGQIYNGQAWKVPIIYAALGTVGYFTYAYYTEMKMFKDEYLRITPNGLSELPEYSGYPPMSIYNMYQSSNKNFQLFVLVSVAAYGLNLLDAYIFGHLYDFDVGDNLAFGVSPMLVPEGTTLSVAPTLNLSFRF